MANIIGIIKVIDIVNIIHTGCCLRDHQQQQQYMCLDIFVLERIIIDQDHIHLYQFNDKM